LLPADARVPAGFYVISSVVDTANGRRFVTAAMAIK
jgi:hypothetical protein